jgi:hypothetical protein
VWELIAKGPKTCFKNAVQVILDLKICRKSSQEALFIYITFVGGYREKVNIMKVENELIELS